MPEDWLLRLIEQVSLMLAELSRLKTGARLDYRLILLSTHLQKQFCSC